MVQFINRNRPRGRVMAVVGGQYGSEGKGVIVNSIAGEWDIHVRVGGPNAGHSFYYGDTKCVMQAIPCGWTNPRAVVVIGRGALINPEILMRELSEIEDVNPGIHYQLIIDANAGVLDPRLHDEGHTHGELHQRIGSTGEGVGAARIARLQRDPQRFYTIGDLIVRESRYQTLAQYLHDDTREFLNDQLRSGKSVLLEGTQGSGLDLVHGPWPYVTTSNCQAAGMIADVGLPPQWLTDVLLVYRSYPIRVAGNSGPLENEITWTEMSKIVGQPIEERTTVTKKVRRVGKWDWDLAKQSAMLNAPTEIALTFADYIDPVIAGADSFTDLGDKVMTFVEEMEAELGTEVTMVSTGGPRWSVARKIG